MYNTANYDSSHFDSNREIFLYVFLDMSNDFSSIDFSDVPNHEIQGIEIIHTEESDLAMKGSMKFAQLSQRMYVSYEMLKDDMHHISPSIRWKPL